MASLSQGLVHLPVHTFEVLLLLASVALTVHLMILKGVTKKFLKLCAFGTVFCFSLARWHLLNNGDFRLLVLLLSSVIKDAYLKFIFYNRLHTGFLLCCKHQGLLESWIQIHSHKEHCLNFFLLISCRQILPNCIFNFFTVSLSSAFEAKISLKN